MPEGSLIALSQFKSVTPMLRRFSSMTQSVTTPQGQNLRTLLLRPQYFADPNILLIFCSNILKNSSNLPASCRQRQKLGGGETAEKAEFVSAVAKNRTRFDLGQGVCYLPMRTLKDDIAVVEEHR